MKELNTFCLEFVEPTTVTVIHEDFLLFSNDVRIKTIHRQSCCESVYADFGSIEDSVLMSNFPIINITLEAVDGSGIRLIAQHATRNEQAIVFVPCYDFQNGYYSSNLELIICDKDNNLLGCFDVAHCTEPNY